MAKLKVLIVSRSKLSADRLGESLADRPEFLVRTRIVANGHVDPLHGISETPDLLLLHYSPGHGELQYLANNSQRDPLPLVVFGPDNDPAAMRLAMQAGARDYFPETVPKADLIASLLRIQDETFAFRSSPTGKLVVCMNGKGGSGGSFLATNLAHSLVVDARQQVTLMDLDLQFGGLCRYLDMTPKIGFLEALEVAKEMDDVSAEAYTSKHPSGLRLLAAPSKRLTLPNEVSIDELDALLSIFLSNNDYVVADSPNRLDAVTEYFLERADNIIVIVQQSLPHIQDTARLLHLLAREIVVPRKRIQIVVNRFSKNSPVELNDMRKALHDEKLMVIPNQYKLATECINSGVPVAEISKNAPLTKAIRKLQEALCDVGNKPPDNFLQRALPSILRR